MVGRIQNNMGMKTDYQETPEFRAAKAFLNRIDPTETEFTWQRIRPAINGTPKHVKRVEHGSLEDLFPAFRKDNDRDYGIYVTLNKTNLTGRTANDIDGIRALFADFDNPTDYPIDQLGRAQGVRPQIINQTSEGKFQAFWLVGDMTKDEYSDYASALALRLGSDRNVTDPCRLVRVPGFKNTKNGIYFPVGNYTQCAEPATYCKEEIKTRWGLNLNGKKKAAKAEDDGRMWTEPGRNSKLTSFAGGLLRKKPEISHNEFSDTVHGENRRRCNPPLDVQEVDGIIESVWKYRDTEAPKNDPEIAFNPVSSKAAALKPRRNTMWIIDGLLPNGVTFIAAAPKMGKSILVQNIAFAITSGWKVLGVDYCEPGQVLYIHYEDTLDELLNREDKMRSAAPHPQDLFYAENCPPLDEGGEDHIRQWLLSQPKPRMVAIDTFEYIRPAPTPGLTPYRQDVSDMKPLRRLAKEFPDVAIVAVTHTREMASKDKLDSAYGTRGISGSLDSGWTAFAEPGGQTAEIYTVGRSVKRQQVGIQFYPDILTWKLTGDIEEKIANRLDKKIIQLFWDEARAMEPVTVAQKLKEERSTVRTAIQRLKFKKVLCKDDSTGKYFLPEKN